jgi:hypothetical protein
MDRLTSFRKPGPRYATLRVVGFLCSLLGVILMVIGGGLLATIGYYAVAPRDAPVDPRLQVAAGFSVLWSCGILFSGLQLLALGAFLRLMIHLEENTRASAQVLDRIRSRLETNPEGVEPIFRP